MSYAHESPDGLAADSLLALVADFSVTEHRAQVALRVAAALAQQGGHASVELIIAVARRDCEAVALSKVVAQHTVPVGELNGAKDRAARIAHRTLAC